VAIQASVLPESKRLAINLCPGPLDEGKAQAPAPDEILLHVNPRRVYKNGCIVINGRRWVGG
jgi:hypothetical protein